jgi:hypothetical protein
MSLPPATKDISASPVKGSVVDPVDRNAQAADVDRKVSSLSWDAVVNAEGIDVDSILRRHRGVAKGSSPR